MREKFEGKNENQKSVFALKWRRRRIFYSMSRITKHKFYDQNFLLKDPNAEKKNGKWENWRKSIAFLQVVTEKFLIKSYSMVPLERRAKLLMYT